jgi:hypothetical protein
MPPRRGSPFCRAYRAEATSKPMEGNSKSRGKKTQRKGSEIQSFPFR